MDKLEKLTMEIMKQMSDDGTPVTKEEAQEMAKMEIGAKGIKRYEKSGKQRKKSEKERKIDPDKLFLINILTDCVKNNNININSQTNEAEFSFLYNENSFTVKLIKHRHKKA